MVAAALAAGVAAVVGRLFLIRFIDGLLLLLFLHLIAATVVSPVEVVATAVATCCYRSSLLAQQLNCFRFQSR